jgi:hypothetical protein
VESEGARRRLSGELLQLRVAADETLASARASQLNAATLGGHVTNAIRAGL